MWESTREEEFGLGRFGIALVGLLLLLALVGCSLGDQPAATDYDPAPQAGSLAANREIWLRRADAFDTALEAALDQPMGTEIELASLTEVEWDRVCSFHEGAPYELINERVGAQVIRIDGRLFSRQHLFFIYQGEVVFDVPLGVEKLYFNIPDTESCIMREQASFYVGGSEETDRRYLVRVK